MSHKWDFAAARPRTIGRRISRKWQASHFLVEMVIPAGPGRISHNNRFLAMHKKCINMRA